VIDLIALNNIDFLSERQEVKLVLTLDSYIRRECV